MFGKNAGRSTTGRSKVPRQPESTLREAVKHLRLTCTRFLADRASQKDLEEALGIMQPYGACSKCGTRPDGHTDQDSK